MNDWASVYATVETTVAEFGTLLFFRGHANPDWRLLPTLARCMPDLRLQQSHLNDSEIERTIYGHFAANAGELLPVSNDVWANVFAMQHHGLPTRLLDWSTTFAVALHFALRDSTGDCAVWILDPFHLNSASKDSPEVYHPFDFSHTYSDYFLHATIPFETDVVALSPLRHNPRVFHQRGGFTLHADLDHSIEELYPDCVRRISIPTEARDGAQLFLKLAGVSEFTLFPDLDGLAREVRSNLFL